MDPTQPVQLSALRQTMRGWSTRSRILAVTVAVLLTAIAAIVYGHAIGPEFTMYDGEYYVMIAKGETASLIQPFASRQLGALVARWIMALFHSSSWHLGFGIEAAISFAFLLIWVFVTMSRTNAPRWLMAACVVLPFWRIVYHGVILPDLFYGALLAFFLLLLEAEQLLLAAAFLLPLMLARESTSLTLVCFLVAAWRRLGWSGRALAVGATAAGSMIVGHLTAHIQNQEHLPQSIYMLAKVPWNTLRLFGIQPWSNLYGLCTEPSWQHSVHMGSLHAIGVCPYDGDTPLIALTLAIGSYGVLPLLLFFLLRARGWKLGNTTIVRFSIIYGVITFFMAPLLGTGYDRLFSYAWPAIVVALPRLWTAPDEKPETSTLAMPDRTIALFFLVHLALAGFSMYVRSSHLLLALIEILMVAAVWVFLKPHFPRPKTV